MIYLVTQNQELFENDNYKIIGVEESLSLLKSLDIVGLDTETEGLDPYTKRLKIVQLGCYDFQIVIDCFTVDIQKYKEYLESERLFIGWNLKFDLKFLYHQRIVPRRVYDGFLAEKLMWLGYPAGIHSMSLKTAGEDYLGVELDKSVRGRIIWAGLTTEVIEYAANDVKYLEKIKEAQEEKLREKGLLTAIDYENRFVLPLAYMEYCGIKLDVEKWKAKMKKDKEREKAAKEACDKWLIEFCNEALPIVSQTTTLTRTIGFTPYDDAEYKEFLRLKRQLLMLGCTLVNTQEASGMGSYTETYELPQNLQTSKTRFEFLKNKYIFIDRQGSLFDGFNLEPQVRINWNSAKQVVEVFKAFGVDVSIEDKEKGGTKDSIDAKTLKPQKDKCSLIPLYLEYKEAVKVTSTYGENFLEQVNKVGRICTNYNQLGADTTRITSGGKDKAARVEYVNLLNLPSDAETRACFVAEELNSWISIDYSGQESFLMASIANDEAMINELMYGDKDLHTLTAKLVFSEIPKDATAAEVKHNYHSMRQLAKGYEFAFNYAGNAETIKRNFGLTDEEANRIYNSYMAGFSGLKRYQDFRRKDWWDKGYILLNEKTGHKAYIYDYEELKRIQAKFKEPGFWEYYREMKEDAPDCDTVQRVKKFFKRKSTSDRQSVNYPIQATGSMCLRVSMINFFEYLRKKNLLFKVLICVAPYDEINCEAPKEMAEDIANTLYNYMVKAGAYFCTRCKLDADVSRLEDGTLPTFWIH